MIFKKIKPTTPSKRSLIQIKNTILFKKPFLKKNIIKTKKSVGKNNLGQITVYHKGGGHKKKYRKIDFLRNDNSIDIVTSIEYDPYRTSFIASLYSLNLKSYRYIIAPKYLKIGDIVKSGNLSDSKLGHSLVLDKILQGTFIHNISIKKNTKGILARAAGNSAILVEKKKKYHKILFLNGKTAYLSSECRATIGIVSNENKRLISLGKAGRNRWLNIRPTVRGVAMNPIDHPHGGGEGKTSGGKPSVTPWGKPYKKKKKKSYSNLY